MKLTGIAVFGLLLARVTFAGQQVTYVNCVDSQGNHVISITHDAKGAHGRVGSAAISKMKGVLYNPYGPNDTKTKYYRYDLEESVTKSDLDHAKNISDRGWWSKMGYNEARHHVSFGTVDFEVNYAPVRGAYNIVEWDEVCNIGFLGINFGCEHTSSGTINGISSALYREFGTITCDITVK